MSEKKETMIGLSIKAHEMLKQLKEDGVFLEMTHGYRVGIALALSRGGTPVEILTKKTTVYSVATIDPDRKLARIVQALSDQEIDSVYTTIEQLADWGVKEMYREYENSGTIDFIKMLESIKE